MTHAGAETGARLAALSEVTDSDVLGMPVDPSLTLTQVVALVRERLAERGRGEAWLVSFANPLAFAIAARDPAYCEDLRRLDHVFSDGIAVTVAARLLAEGHCPIERISFDSTSLALPVFAAAAELGRDVALVGGRGGVAEAAAAQLRRAYPELRVSAALHGYSEEDALLERLLRLAPAVIVCGMGAPRQERLLLRLKAAGWRGCGFTCGGYLDQLTGGIHYYPRFVDAWNLRWLYRIYREPRRLGWRYAVDYARFYRLFLVACLRRLARWSPRPPTIAPGPLGDQRDRTE